MNNNLSTVIIAPMTTKSHDFPTRVQVDFQGKTGWVVLDQIRAIDKIRLIKVLGKLDTSKVKEIKDILNEMLVM